MTDPTPRELEQRLHEELGWKPLHAGWAKLEILFGLVAVSAGHLCGIYGIVHVAAPSLWYLIVASLLLQSLGGYLALAGHRSHVYQSQNKLAGWLAAQIAERGR
jgi:hypothetical protein